jgi:hypothetical protein
VFVLREGLARKLLKVTDDLSSMSPRGYVLVKRNELTIGKNAACAI